MRTRVLRRLLVPTVTVAALCGTVLAQDGPREFVVLVGAGQDSTTLNTYFPEVLRVRVGDTVTWRLNSDEIHTVSFAFDLPAEEVAFAVLGPQGPMVNPMAAFPTRPPGAPVEAYSGTGFVSSGIMERESPVPDAPPNDTFTLTFDQPGTFAYYCLIHEKFMVATVTVEPAGATDLPTPEEVEARALAAVEPLLAALEEVRSMAQEARVEPGPGGTDLVFVKAGILDVLTPDVRSELLEFLPQDVTVRAGDTVVWGSTGFHTITFVPRGPTPPLVVPEPQEAGPPLLYLNLEVLTPAKPDPVYDPQQYYNSGDIGFFSRGGASWALTFEQPGVYDYVCAIHEQLGMVGTVTVVPR
jgi:plastocyanin